MGELKNGTPEKPEGMDKTEGGQGDREAGVPYFEDLRDVPVATRRILKRAVVVAAALTALAAIGVVGFACWFTGILSVVALCCACWVDAARKLAYCRQWWKRGKPYDEWSF